MTNSDQTVVRRFGEHKNSFGLLRLIFASLVIISHVPEIIYGNRSHEVLTQIFHTISFGELAVDGFFIVSGYLIVGSFLKNPDWFDYTKKRVARIYPGFILASIITVFIAAPIGLGNPFGSSDMAHAFARMLTLQEPKVPGSFPGTHFPAVNAAMWTIIYEFRCYILVLVLGLTGALRHPWIVATLALVMLLAFVSVPVAEFSRIDQILGSLTLVFGSVPATVRLTGIFLCGSLFYLWKDRIRYSLLRALIAAVLLIACMFSSKLSEPAVATFGAYIIFAIATGVSSQVNNQNDISYGVYLYAWPVTKLLLWFWPELYPALASLLTFAIACLCGWLSWHLIEKPAMQLLRRSALGHKSPRRDVG